MTDLELTRDLCAFIERSPTAFHAVASATEELEQAGFRHLRERDVWQLAPGDRAFVTRNDSSLVAFVVGEALCAEDLRFQMAAAHTDSPTFKVKQIPELDGPKGTLRLNVEGYGGMLDATWMDRPLGLAGRVVVRRPDGGLESRLVATDAPVALIPNVAIHQRRDANQGFAYNHQVDLLPLVSAGALGQGSFTERVAALAGVGPGELVAHDLFLCNRTPANVWGWADEFVSAPRLDDLQCAFAALRAFLAAHNPSCVTVLALFDNEEVGSGTRQGACSTFLRDVLVRAASALGRSEAELPAALAASFMVSCDNAHAVHPNHPELYDADNGARINGGVVVKEMASQRYATDAFSRAVFCELCRRAGVAVQTFANRSDSAGGSTLGNLSTRQVSVPTVDVGLPQLAMHSSYETAGTHDTAALLRALEAFYAADLRIDEGEASLG